MESARRACWPMRSKRLQRKGFRACAVEVLIEAEKQALSGKLHGRRGEVSLFFASSPGLRQAQKGTFEVVFHVERSEPPPPQMFHVEHPAACIHPIEMRSRCLDGRSTKILT